MRVTIKELRRFANLLFDHLETSGQTEVEIDKDYYWFIPDDAVHSVYQEPSKFTVGQLSQDMEALRDIEAGKRPPIGYAFTWLSALLRFVGSKVIS